MNPTKVQQQAWRSLCNAINQASMGPVVDALKHHGVWHALSSTTEPIALGTLAERYHAREGLLACVGRWFEILGWGGLSPQGLRLTATETFTANQGQSALNALIALAKLYDQGAAPRLALGCGMTEKIWGQALQPLAALGWVVEHPSGLALNEAGRAGMRMAAQSLYTAGYAPLLSQVRELFASDGEHSPGFDSSGDEWHVERDADITFSAAVYESQCQAAVCELVLKALQTAPETPQAIVDTGAGNGALLLGLHAALIEADITAPRLVAIEPSGPARRQCQVRLAPLGGLALAGNINDPDEMALTLKAHGIDMQNCLHINKSVMHNRSVIGQPAGLDDALVPFSCAVHLNQAFEQISAAQMAGDLVAAFERWRPWVQRHGLVMLEPHAIDPAVLGKDPESHPLLGTEITHVLSGQHLVEQGFHRRCAELAGLSAAVSLNLQQDLLGAPIMSADLWRAVAG
ncbi:MAG: hypothetical protein KGY57_03000 [Gammaproteobacteria bacterium]|nr:hypothetical protein [Gammaproteobacteria bacterium]